MSQLRYILKRSVITVFLLFFVLLALFVFFRLMPGDFTARMTAQGASPEEVEAFRDEWGLNDPIHIQFISYMENLILLDPGMSVAYNVDVWEYVKMRVFNTFILAAPAITLAYIIAIIVGGKMGSDRESRFDRYGISTLIGFGAVPEFFMGILLVYVFSSTLGLLPPAGMLSPGTEYGDLAWWRPYFTRDFGVHYILPFSAVVLRFLYSPTLIMRTSTVETMNEEFIYYKKIAGIPDRRRLRHLIRHSILPVITLYPITMTQAISGIVLIEIVFNWPGIGFALVQAIFARDFPVIQFIFFITAAGVIIGNFVIDILYGIIDPRVSVGGDDS